MSGSVSSRQPAPLPNNVSMPTVIGVRARGAAAAPDSGKTIIFRAKAKLFGQKQKPKMKKICIFFCKLLNEKT